MANKILIVEDEEAIRKFVRINLEKAGFEVVEAESGEEGIRFLQSSDIDIVVLDIMLPGIDGFETAKILRRDFPALGIIMLTAKSQDVDKIKGLESGTDDYMVKPFNPKELVLRIKSLLRRLGKTQEKGFSIDSDNHTFYKNGKEISLTPTEFSLIDFLMKNPMKTFTREEILGEVWGYQFLGDTKIVDVNVRRLRAKIEEDPGSPAYIETVWGVGYRWSDL